MKSSDGLPDHHPEDEVQSKGQTLSCWRGCGALTIVEPCTTWGQRTPTKPDGFSKAHRKRKIQWTRTGRQGLREQKGQRRTARGRPNPASRAHQG